MLTKLCSHGCAERICTDLCKKSLASSLSYLLDLLGVIIVANAPRHLSPDLLLRQLRPRYHLCDTHRRAWHKAQETTTTTSAVSLRCSRRFTACVPNCWDCERRVSQATQAVRIRRLSLHSPRALVRFSLSPWILPTIAFCLAIVVLINSVPIPRKTAGWIRLRRRVRRLG